MNTLIKTSCSRYVHKATDYDGLKMKVFHTVGQLAATIITVQSRTISDKTNRTNR